MSGDATISNLGALTLASSGVTASSYGTAAEVPTIAVDSKGRITSAANTAISIPASAINNATIAAGSSVSGSNTGDQTITLTGDVSGSGTGTFGTTLANSGVTANTYGSATAVPVFAVDAKGRITSVTNTTITGVSPIGSALTSGDIIVGNSSNLASAVAMSGDAAISNTGAVTVASVGGSTAINIHSAELLANAATNLNTASS